jgi:hypothetical protein
MPTLTNEIIAAAIEGFESQKKRIDGQIAELRSLLTGGPARTAAAPEGTVRKRGKFSDATRLKMKEAQQRRWAKIKGESEPSTPASVPARPKRQMSEAGRLAIAEAVRRRWAAKKASKSEKTSTASSAKKASRKKAAAKKPVGKQAAVKVPAA